MIIFHDMEYIAMIVITFDSTEYIAMIILYCIALHITLHIALYIILHCIALHITRLSMSDMTSITATMTMIFCWIPSLT